MRHTSSHALSDGPARTLRILVADDEPMITAALERILTGRGHDVRTTSNAADALAVLESERFDAALVDMGMPGSGMSVIEHLELDPDFDGLVVLMSGGLSTDPLLQAGPDVVRLQKPFRFSELVPLVEDGTRY